MAQVYLLPLLEITAAVIDHGQLTFLQERMTHSLLAFSSAATIVPGIAEPNEGQMAGQCASELKSLLKGCGVPGRQLRVAARDLVVGIALGHPPLSAALDLGGMNKIIDRCHLTEEELAEEERTLDESVRQAMSTFLALSPLTPEAVQSLRDLRARQAWFRGEKYPDDLHVALERIEMMPLPAAVKIRGNKYVPSVGSLLESLKALVEAMDLKHAVTPSLMVAQLRHDDLRVEIERLGPHFKMYLLEKIDSLMPLLKKQVEYRRVVSPSCKDIKRLECQLTLLEIAKRQLQAGVSV